MILGRKDNLDNHTHKENITSNIAPYTHSKEKDKRVSPNSNSTITSKRAGTQPIVINASIKSVFFTKYDLREVIGEGNTSKCFRTVRKSDGAVFACKVLDKRNAKSKFSSTLLDQLLTEAHVLRLL